MFHSDESRGQKARETTNRKALQFSTSRKKEILFADLEILPNMLYAESRLTRNRRRSMPKTETQTEHITEPGSLGVKTKLERYIYFMMRGSCYLHHCDGLILSFFFGPKPASTHTQLTFLIHQLSLFMEVAQNPLFGEKG